MPHDSATLVSGRYELISLLGEGASKRVYRARDLRLDRDVALALVRPAGLDEASLERIRREAQSLARLSHPNIVTIFDVGDDGGTPYFVSELMGGGDLRSLLEHTPDGRLPVDRASEIAIGLCHALAAAHETGTIHRDLKPGNVWLTTGGTPKLGDFGLAVMVDRTRMTQAAMLVGTPAYLAPEQALGGEITPRTDLYSLGVLLYELVTGRRPFVGDDAVAVIYQHIYNPPVAPTWHNDAVPQALEALILRLLAKNPTERPASATEAAADLVALAQHASAPATPREVPAANPLDRLAAGVFVGRQSEMGELRAELDEALAGRTWFALLVGEPGSGKTRSAEEVATYARLRGARVVWGRCYEEGAPAYWPWIQTVRALAEEQSPEALAEQMGSGAAEIAQLVSVVRERLPMTPSPAPLDPEQARFRFFESVMGYLRSASRARPLLLVLDDLQWADKSSLLLLQFLARELREARLLVLGTYRDEEFGRQHPLAQALAELARSGISRRVQLDRLSERDVSRFIELNAALTPPPRLVEAVYRETEGHAFSMIEVVRLLAADGRLARADVVTSWEVALPQSVREVVSRRLAHLSEACTRALGVASVIDREFDLSVLQRVTGQSEDDLLELLEEAVAARIVAEAPHAIGRFGFTHALIRETLSEDLSRTRRVRLHRQTGEALEQVYARNPDAHLAEIAHHFVASAPGGDVDRAVTYARRAADRALTQLAYDEAARWYRVALDTLALRDEEPGDEDARCSCELLLALGDAQNKADEIAAADESFTQAAAIARRLGLAEHLARAALGYGDVEPAPGDVNTAKVSMLQDALALLPPGDGARRARVTARLALELYFKDDEQRVAALGREAAAMARRVGDPGTLAYALHAERMVATWADPPAQRLPLATEMIALAEQAGDGERAVIGRFWRLSDLLELGDMPAVDAQIEDCARQADALRQPVYRWYAALARAMRAMLDGRFDEAERLAGEALAMGQRSHGAIALQSYGGQLLVIRREQGRLAELEPVLQAMVAQSPTAPAWRSALGFVHAELDRETEARAEFERLAARDFSDLPRDILWLVMLTVLAETCVFLGDAPRAALLHDLLLPYQGRNLVLANALACMGAASFYLGILAATMGRYDPAEASLQEALAMHERMGARPWVARTAHAYAGLLLRRNAPSDRERAEALLGRAGETARSLGMKRLEAQIAALGAPA